MYTYMYMYMYTLHILHIMRRDHGPHRVLRQPGTMRCIGEGVSATPLFQVPLGLQSGGDCILAHAGEGARAGEGMHRRA